MYVRKVRAGKKVFFQIGNKVSGRFVLVKHVGSASSPDQIDLLHQKALTECERLKLEIRPTLFPLITEKEKAKLTSWRITGFHRVFGHIYDNIGFPQNHLRDLVVARIAYPRSKLATARYLEQYLGISPEDRIYRFLDTLNKDELTKIAFDFVKKKNNGLALIFYNVTTLYFESNDEDDLRKRGYSKDHKNGLPQIVIGLFVDQDKIDLDQRHDGLKGYWTNLKTKIKPQEVIDQYHNLWRVEKAFRMSKSDLLERPIFHRKEKRISGHLLICFSSLLVMKETERLIKEINISLAKSIELLGKVGQGEMRLGKISMPIESELNPKADQILNHILGH